MAIKWKSFPNWFYHSALKSVACILIAVCTGTAFIIGSYMNTHISYANVMEESYMTSNARVTEMNSIARSTIRLLKTYKNEDYVRSGGTIDMESVEENIVDKYYGSYYDDYKESLSPIAEEEYVEVPQNVKKVKQMLKEKILAEHAQDIEIMKQEKIVEALQSYFSLVEGLNQTEGVYYYATNGQMTVSNVLGANKEFFKGQPAYLLFDHGKYEGDDRLANYSEFGNVTVQDEVYVALSAEQVQQREQIFLQDKQYMDRIMLYITLMFALDIFAMLYLFFAVGHKAGDEAIHLCPVDRIYTDFNVIAEIILIILTIAACVGLHDYLDAYHQYAGQEEQLASAGGILHKPVIFISLSAAIFTGTAMVLTLFLSLVRQFKARQLLSHSLAGVIIRKIWHGIRLLMKKGPVLLISSGELSLVRGGVQKVKDGNLEHRINLPQGKMLYGLAQDINTMSDGLQKAVEKELQAERLKTELITNVSHDLKTPLTSIINYSDLLTREELTPDYANDYAKVLKDKSEKLKQLTSDLFEISKVQSGNIEVQTEALQVKELIMQSIAEYEEKFKEAQLSIRISAVPDDLYILSDGKKMARVLENLVVNILKYAQPQTRVYIDTLEQDGKCKIIFKNIANYEMNFSAAEIVQRFARGDASRTTDGNGLGLAIVQSYVEACGGTFDVAVDGDLFKATVAFDVLQQENQE